MLLTWNDFVPVVVNVNFLTTSPSYQFGPRIITGHQFIYVHKGRGIANIQERSYRATAGDLFYYGPEVLHHFIADATIPFEVIGIHFFPQGQLDVRKSPVFIPIDVNSDQVSDSPYASTSNQFMIKNEELELYELQEHMNISSTNIPELFFQMVRQFRESTMQSAAFNRGLLIQCFSLLSQIREISNVPETPHLKMLNSIKNNLNSQAHHRYNRTWVKDWTGYNEDYISRLFKEEFGISLHSYHLNQKIQHARKLLHNKDLTVTKISEILHFGSIHHFSRTFKKFTSLSPLEYRRLQNTL